MYAYMASTGAKGKADSILSTSQPVPQVNTRAIEAARLLPVHCRLVMPCSGTQLRESSSHQAGGCLHELFNGCNPVLLMHDRLKQDL